METFTTNLLNTSLFEQFRKNVFKNVLFSLSSTVNLLFGTVQPFLLPHFMQFQLSDAVLFSLCYYIISDTKNCLLSFVNTTCHFFIAIITNYHYSKHYLHFFVFFFYFYIFRGFQIVGLKRGGVKVCLSS